MREIIDKSLQLEDITIFMKIFKLYKSYLALLSDQKELGIGDVTLSSPPTIAGMKSTSSSFKLFGIHNNLTSSIIAKRLSTLLKAPVLVLLFLKSEIHEEEIIRPIIDFVNKHLEQIKKSHQSEE
ncbi:MAG: hypothetical protein KGD63_12460 [Candidatus Lokiarchaeota archaeon]|nr:hypothetical protein [Candidatus Lokiarchaeota archaeon]